MISTILLFVSSLFFVGLVNITKNKLSGRKGPGVFQPIKDIIRLLKKGTVYSETTSIVFKIAPLVYLATILVATCFIPLGQTKGIISFKGDFVVFAYLLALGKFFMIISALDTGSSFEGMGASREALYSLLAEPAFFILIGSLGLLTGYSSFYSIFDSIQLTPSFSSIVSFSLGILGAYIFFMLGLIENSRIPIDDPKTHLELTMIHEVMVLDNSGFDLGLILYASGLKFVIYGALIANLFTTSKYSLYANIFIFIITQSVYAILVGVVESFMARFRMNQNPQFIFALASVALLIFIGVMILIGKFS